MAACFEQPLTPAVVKQIESGRASGRIVLSGQGLLFVPPQVYDVNVDLPPVKGSKTAEGQGQWWGAAEVKKLDLCRNLLKALPEELPSSLGESLTALDVSHNQLEALPATLSSLYHLASLACNNNRLFALPPLPLSLVLLSAHHNQLSSLPSSLARCSELTKLDCAHNQLQALPSEAMQGLGSSLTELDCSCNQLKELPSDMGCLSKLKILHVVHNKLTSLPSSIVSCRSLVELHAGQNALREIPPELGLCTALRHLSLRDNRIQGVPLEVCGLQLYVLDLQSCDLSSLPPQLGLMTSLKSLLLDGNALRTIRRPLITGPVSALLRFLASRIPEGEATVPAPAQAAQSGNIFGQDASSLAADLTHKLAVANGISRIPMAAAQPHGAPSAQDYRYGPGYGGGVRQQPPCASSYSEPRQAPCALLEGQYSCPTYPGYDNNLQQGYSSSSSSSMYPQGQPACGPFAAQERQGYYSQYLVRSTQAYGQPPSYSLTQGGQSQGPGYSQGPGPYGCVHDPVERCVHDSATASSSRGFAYPIPRGQQDPQPPSYQHQPQPPSFRAAHESAPFATAATPPLPAPRPTVGKTSLPKEELLLSGMGLREAPEEIWEAASGLSRLDLSNNQISSLPAEGFMQCTQLRTLLLSRTGLNTWPLPLVPCMPQLRDLNLAGNRGITFVPPGAFASCPGLVSLNLSGVPGAGNLAPRTLASLTSLQSLDLSFTGCTQAPVQELISLANLRVLNLSSNRISFLPADICLLNRLEELVLSNNDISNLPPQLGLLAGSLRSLLIDGNPMRSIRRPIIERGTASLLSHLQERIPA